METAPVIVRLIGTVEYDCIIYSVSDDDIRLICKNLKQDPFLGEPADATRYEYLFNGMSVLYIVHDDRDGIVVTLVAIRPPEQVSKTRKAYETAKRVYALAKELHGLLSIFRGGG